MISLLPPHKPPGVGSRRSTLHSCREIRIPDRYIPPSGIFPQQPSDFSLVTIKHYDAGSWTPFSGGQLAIQVTGLYEPIRNFWTGETFPPPPLDMENCGIPGAEWYRVRDPEQKKNGIPVRDYTGEK